uniref:Uncharacterized protein n=1 Tax=Salix viminalis TaxID=40686 RepID=A0A6N2M6I0_SALVM
MSLKSSETFDIRHPNSYHPKLLLLKNDDDKKKKKKKKKERTKTYGFPLNFCCFMHERNDRQNNTSGRKKEKKEKNRRTKK